MIPSIVFKMFLVIFITSLIADAKKQKQDAVLQSLHASVASFSQSLLVEDCTIYDTFGI